jgi:hypothetical protein
MLGGGHGGGGGIGGVGVGVGVGIGVVGRVRENSECVSESVSEGVNQ